LIDDFDLQKTPNKDYTRTCIKKQYLNIFFLSYSGINEIHAIETELNEEKR